MSTTKHITTTCTRDCPNTCGLVATVENGRVTRLVGSKSHPLTKGIACHKTSKYIKRIYSEERISHPMLRSTTGWEKVSWDEVLDLIAQKMHSIRDQDGGDAILYYQGYGERTGLKLLNTYFFNLFGGVTTPRGSLCGGTGQASQNLDFGHRISHDPLDHVNSKAIIFWARNPASTNISLVPIAKEIRKQGGRVITIDPYKNKTAAFADHHIAPAPGTDIYLAMAAAKIIYEKGAEDTSFLEQHTQGVTKFKEILDSHSIAELCKYADVTEQDAYYLANTLIEYKPASILLGWGLHRHKDAQFSIRAIDALGAIAGNIGIAGGGVSQGFEEYGPYDQRYWGHDLCPSARTLLLPQIGEEILTANNPKIRMIFTSATNPVCMAPNSDKVAKAFKQTEFVVYSGHFLDDTADYADVFLPATMFLEEDDVMASYGHNYVGPVNKVIEPVGECLSDFDMFSKLAERFSFAKQFCRTREDWLFDICAPIREQGCGMEQLRQGPFRYPEPMVPYENKIFPTSSGKFEFMTEFKQELIGRIDPKFPLKLLTVAAHSYICSERSLAEHTPLAVVLLHPIQAAQSGLKNGMIVWVASRQGKIKALLQTNEAVRKDCLVTERGGWIKAGHGLNKLTLDITSTIGDGTPYYETSVNVTASVEDIDESFS